MTTYVPRAPYSDGELQELFPPGLALEQVIVTLRHGERTPVHPRFGHVGVPRLWPFCESAQRMKAAVLTADGSWDHLDWASTMEEFSKMGVTVPVKGKDGLGTNICIAGQLTDVGRQTTLNLGQRLGNLYISQLGFMPKTLADPNTFYLRSTHLPRALDSVQQAFVGMYPAKNRTCGPLPIVSRTAEEDTLPPNEAHCTRYKELMMAFAGRTADRWDNSDEMKFLNTKLSKYMPNNNPVKINGHPKLSGILDHLNSTLAAGPEVHLPSEFYEPEVRRIIDQIESEEWFSGYHESEEYRRVGIGGYVGDVVTQLVGYVEQTQKNAESSASDLKSPIKFAMSGAHDTTLAGMLAGLGCFDKKWPPYTSHIAVELFKADPSAVKGIRKGSDSTSSSLTASLPSPTASLRSMVDKATTSSTTSTTPTRGADPNTTIARIPTPDLSPSQLSRLDGYYVRLRYNDRAVTIPGCALPGKHFPGQESFCTLAEFKKIADKFTPKDWEEECKVTGDPKFPMKLEPAGY